MLMNAMRKQNTLVCCGLDPEIARMPSEITEKKIPDEDKIFEFLKTVTDITAAHVCAFKAQKAFFDAFDGGRKLLRDTISYIHDAHPQIQVFVDAKIGDTENTMKAYKRNILGELNADGVVVNPYLGDDVFADMADYKEKTLLVVVRSSNPGSGSMQDVKLSEGIALWEHVLRLTLGKWNEFGNLVPILSSNVDAEYVGARTLIPDTTPILLAGYGAQGGTLKHLNRLLNSERQGVFVNSSRLLLYPAEKNARDWRNRIEQNVIRMKNDINQVRYGTKVKLE